MTFEKRFEFEYGEQTREFYISSRPGLLHVGTPTVSKQMI
jgi:hypothetical protein